MLLQPLEELKSVHVEEASTLPVIASGRAGDLLVGLIMQALRHGIITQPCISYAWADPGIFSWQKGGGTKEINKHFPKRRGPLDLPL